MPLTKPIPKEARSIVRRIRKDVKKPNPDLFSQHGAHDVPCLRSENSRCPMGMLPYSYYRTPTSRWQFEDKRISNNAIRMFWQWWDKQSDVKASIEAVWGKE